MIPILPLLKQIHEVISFFKNHSFVNIIDLKHFETVFKNVNSLAENIEWASLNFIKADYLYVAPAYFLNKLKLLKYLLNSTFSVGNK